MIILTDLVGNKVELTYGMTTDTKEISNVLCISKIKDQWLCTRHRVRGIEFPGGKVEQGETPEFAAKREIWEETGGVVQFLRFIGQYKVISQKDYFVKGIYFAAVEKLEKKDDYLETGGPVLLEPSTAFQNLDESFSFIMRDGVVEQVMNYVRTHKLDQFPLKK
ncbi:antimutator 8-oxo-(dGTP/GTP)ase [Bacillus carboniphilus]|uniref:Antimutator 8-oxo-(dGTP/GTP)ase n=1 Tax=Bacillus carboniphilus TaxID=86663 RepID=A0ABP3G0Y6_9BACI